MADVSVFCYDVHVKFRGDLSRRRTPLWLYWQRDKVLSRCRLCSGGAAVPQGGREHRILDYAFLPGCADVLRVNEGMHLALVSLPIKQ
jgi:hypothetical protein